jgi:hypothetical protein
MARCKQKFAVKRRECRVAVSSEEGILDKFFRPRRERPSPGTESALVTKTWAPLGYVPRECPLWGGGGDR